MKVDASGNQTSTRIAGAIHRYCNSTAFSSNSAVAAVDECLFQNETLNAHFNSSSSIQWAFAKSSITADYIMAFPVYTMVITLTVLGAILYFTCRKTRTVQVEMRRQDKPGKNSPILYSRLRNEREPDDFLSRFDGASSDLLGSSEVANV